MTKKLIIIMIFKLGVPLLLKHFPPFQNHWIFMHFLLLLYLFSPLVKASELCQIVISSDCFNVDFPVFSLLFTTISRNHSSSAPQVVGMFPVIMDRSPFFLKPNLIIPPLLSHCLFCHCRTYRTLHYPTESLLLSGLLETEPFIHSCIHPFICLAS